MLGYDAYGTPNIYRLEEDVFELFVEGLEGSPRLISGDPNAGSLLLAGYNGLVLDGVCAQ